MKGKVAKETTGATTFSYGETSGFVGENAHNVGDLSGHFIACYTCLVSNFKDIKLTNASYLLHISLTTNLCSNRSSCD